MHLLTDWRILSSAPILHGQHKGCRITRDVQIFCSGGVWWGYLQHLHYLHYLHYLLDRYQTLHWWQEVPGAELGTRGHGSIIGQDGRQPPGAWHWHWHWHWVSRPCYSDYTATDGS